MKIILVSPYSENLVGGIVNWTKYIVNYYREYSGDVDMSLLYNENAVQVMEASNPLERLMNGLRNYLPIYRKFNKKTVDEHFDLVHICTSASLGLIRDLLIVQAARKKGIKTVVHMHFGRIPQILKTKGWERYLLLRLMKRIDCAIVMDRVSLHALETSGFNNVCFLPNPLSDEVQQSIVRQGKLNRESRKIVFAGHVTETKGVCELAEACRNIPDIKIEILGKVVNDEIRERLLKEGGNNAKEWLHIKGNRPIEEVIKEMLSCTAFVLPSYSEGFPNVILESMACGCPIIATPVGAIPEMLDIDGERPCGVCVPVKDSDALHKAILDFLDNPYKRRTMGENAQYRVNEMYVMPKVWEQLIGIWESLIR